MDSTEDYSHIRGKLQSDRYISRLMRNRIFSERTQDGENEEKKKRTVPKASFPQLQERKNSASLYEKS